MHACVPIQADALHLRAAADQPADAHLQDLDEYHPAAGPDLHRVPHVSRNPKTLY